MIVFGPNGKSKLREISATSIHFQTEYMSALDTKVLMPRNGKADSVILSNFKRTSTGTLVNIITSVMICVIHEGTCVIFSHQVIIRPDPA